MSEEILRPDVADQPLENATQYALRNGLKKSTVRNRMNNYSDQAPQPVLLVNGREKFFLVSELDTFIKETGRPEGEAGRSPLQVAESEVHRLRLSVAEGERRRNVRRADFEKAEQHLLRVRKQLAETEEWLDRQRAVEG